MATYTYNELQKQGEYLQEKGYLFKWLVNQVAQRRPDNHQLFMARLLCEQTSEEDLRSIGITFDRNKMARSSTSWLLEGSISNEILAEILLADKYSRFMSDPSNQEFLQTDFMKTPPTPPTRPTPEPPPVLHEVLPPIEDEACSRGEEGSVNEHGLAADEEKNEEEHDEDEKEGIIGINGDNGDDFLRGSQYPSNCNTEKGGLKEEGEEAQAEERESDRGPNQSASKT